MNDKSRVELVEADLLNLALWPLSFFFSYLLVTGLLRFVGVVSPVVSAVAALGLAGALVGLSTRPSPWRWSASLIAAGLLCLVSIWLASICPDISYDGQAIHFPNAIAMADGVNPLYQRPIFPFGDIYPNGFWTLQGLAITVTSGFEEGKAPAWLLAFASAPLVAVALRALRGAWTPSVGIAALLVQLNPVLLMQLTSFELDAPVYSLAVDMIAGAVLLSTRHRRAGLVIVACACVLLANTKITGLYWAVAIAAATVLQTWLQERRLNIALMAVIAACIAVVGWTPYVTVPLETGRLFGTSLAVVIEGPQNLENAGAAMRMAYLLFGRSSNPITPELARLQWPWESVLDAPAHLFDIRIGGFGPAFGLQVLGALLVGGSLAWRMRRSHALRNNWLGPFWTAVILVATLLFPVSWWARLSAPFWLMVVLPLVWPPQAPSSGPTRAMALAGWLMVSIGLVVNCVSVVSTLLTVATVTQGMNRSFAEIAGQGHAVRIVPPPSAVDQAAVLWQQRLIRLGIYPRIGSLDGCAQPPFAVGSVQLCVDATRP